MHVRSAFLSHSRVLAPGTGSRRQASHKPRKERRTLTEETRAATEADKVLPLDGLSKFLLIGAENAATRAAEGADERPALAATRAEALVIEAATIVTLEFACVSSV